MLITLTYGVAIIDICDVKWLFLLNVLLESSASQWNTEKLHFMPDGAPSHSAPPVHAWNG